LKTSSDLRERALRCLARREYSRAELRSKLLHPPWHRESHPEESGHDEFGYDESGSEEFSHGEHIDPEKVEALLDDLAESGYLSDARATTQLLHAKRSRFGTQRILHELHHKGISEELIDEALPELQAGEQETARQVWQKKFGSLPKDAREKAKQVRFLQSRGFGFDIILKVLKIPDAEDC
jgi:regulatory protein